MLIVRLSDLALLPASPELLTHQVSPTTWQVVARIGGANGNAAILPGYQQHRSGVNSFVYSVQWPYEMPNGERRTASLALKVGRQWGVCSGG